MEKRILLEQRGRAPSEVKELQLDNCRSSSIVGLTDEFCSLETLSMINVGLVNLRGFPKLPNLKKLDLSDNRISGGLNQLSTNCPKLQSLHLSGNRIDSIDVLEPLKELSSLNYLELCNCEVTSMENYREKVFAFLPNLKYLDGFDENDKEVDELDSVNGRSGASTPENEMEGSSSTDDSDEDSEPGLECLQNSTIDEESEGDDYNPEGEDNTEDEDIEDDDSDDDIDESDKEKSPRGQKRKLESDE